MQNTQFMGGMIEILVSVRFSSSSSACQCQGGWPHCERNGLFLRSDLMSSWFRNIRQLGPEGWNARRGAVCYADVQKAGLGMIKCLRKEQTQNMSWVKWATLNSVSWVCYFLHLSWYWNNGYSLSHSGTRGCNSPYKSRHPSQYFSPLRLYRNRIFYSF